MENKTLAVVVLAALIVGGGFYFGGSDVSVNAPGATVNVPPSTTLGAQSGPEHYGEETFFDVVNLEAAEARGGLTSIIEGTSSVVTAAIFCDNGVIDHSPRATAQVLQLPTSSLIIGKTNCLPEVGDFKEVLLRNTSSTATSTFVVTAGQSSTLHTVVSTSTSADTVAGGGAALLRAYYTTSSENTAVDWVLLNGTNDD